MKLLGCVNRTVKHSLIYQTGVDKDTLALALQHIALMKDYNPKCQLHTLTMTVKILSSISN